MDAASVISSLNYKNSELLLKKKQTVSDIINEMVIAHKEFCSDYDKIFLNFSSGNTRQLCDRLFNFLKKNITYKVEPEARQTIKSPAAILKAGEGDCKHYASFAAGILDAFCRAGKKINWKYCFASYDVFNSEPEHVFVIINDKGNEIWIDPTPGADKVKPVWTIKKTVKTQNEKMALYKISGIENVGYSDLLTDEDYIKNPAFYNSIILLMNYGILKNNGTINNEKLVQLKGNVSENQYTEIINAMKNLNHSGAVSGFFDTVWRGVKKVTLAVPRIAYLSLVNLNVRGWATKLHRAVYNEDGTYTKYKESIKKLWQDRLGGDWTKLENTINKGWKKKAILGSLNSVGAAEAAAWVATASAIIAAITPLVEAILKALNKNQAIPMEGGGYLPETTGANLPNEKQNSINPLLLIGGGAAALYFLTKKK